MSYGFFELQARTTDLERLVDDEISTREDSATATYLRQIEQIQLALIGLDL